MCLCPTNFRSATIPTGNTNRPNPSAGRGSGAKVGKKGSCNFFNVKKFLTSDFNKILFRNCCSSCTSHQPFWLQLVLSEQMNARVFVWCFSCWGFIFICGYSLALRSPRSFSPNISSLITKSLSLHICIAVFKNPSNDI